jgi:hypothetical protein
VSVEHRDSLHNVKICAGTDDTGGIDFDYMAEYLGFAGHGYAEDGDSDRTPELVVVTYIGAKNSCRGYSPRRIYRPEAAEFIVLYATERARRMLKKSSHRNDVMTVSVTVSGGVYIPSETCLRAIRAHLVRGLAMNDPEEYYTFASHPGGGGPGPTAPEGPRNETDPRAARCPCDFCARAHTFDRNMSSNGRQRPYHCIMGIRELLEKLGMSDNKGDVALDLVGKLCVAAYDIETIARRYAPLKSERLAGISIDSPPSSDDEGNDLTGEDEAADSRRKAFGEELPQEGESAKDLEAVKRWKFQGAQILEKGCATRVTGIHYPVMIGYVDTLMIREWEAGLPTDLADREEEAAGTVPVKVLNKDKDDADGSRLCERFLDLIMEAQAAAATAKRELLRPYLDMIGKWKSEHAAFYRLPENRSALESERSDTRRWRKHYEEEDDDGEAGGDSAEDSDAWMYASSDSDDDDDDSILYRSSSSDDDSSRYNSDSSDCDFPAAAPATPGRSPDLSSDGKPSPPTLRAADVKYAKKIDKAFEFGPWGIVEKRLEALIRRFNVFGFNASRFDSVIVCRQLTLLCKARRQFVKVVRSGSSVKSIALGRGLSIREIRDIMPPGISLASLGVLCGLSISKGIFPFDACASEEFLDRAELPEDAESWLNELNPSASPSQAEVDEAVKTFREKGFTSVREYMADYLAYDCRILHRAILKMRSRFEGILQLDFVDVAKYTISSLSAEGSQVYLARRRLPAMFSPNHSRLYSVSNAVSV